MDIGRRSKLEFMFLLKKKITRNKELIYYAVLKLTNCWGQLLCVWTSNVPLKNNYLPHWYSLICTSTYTNACKQVHIHIPNV